jgi:heat shock protein HslJ
MGPRTKSRLPIRIASLPLLLGLAGCSGQADGPMAASPIPGVDTGRGVASTGTAASPLQGKWRLQRLQKSDQTIVQVQEPDRFVADFAADGKVQLVADCNRCSAGYSAGASALSVSPMACTRAYCQSSPLDTDFAQLVSAATTWSVGADQLTLRSPEGSLLLGR